MAYDNFPVLFLAFWLITAQDFGIPNILAQVLRIEFSEET